MMEVIFLYVKNLNIFIQKRKMNYSLLPYVIMEIQCNLH